MTVTYDPRGREGIGVVQPRAGTDYPLVDPSPDVRHLIADAYLGYDDPGDYGGTAWQLPFRIDWLFGFGTDTATPVSNAPAPTHSADLRILDATGQLVFDSTLAVPGSLSAAPGFSQRAWGPRLHIYEWLTLTAHCRIVVHTQWSPDEDPAPQEYPSAFGPQSAVLDVRTCERWPRRVRTVSAVLAQYRQTSLEFVAGYNMQLATTPRTGVRAGASITVDATAGGGLGVYPGCQPEPLYIRKINGIAPATGGHFHLAAGGCYFVRQPLHTDDAITPQIQRAPGSQLDLALPDALAGQSKEAAGWPVADSPAYAHLKLGNDCQACCDCDDYIAVAEYLNRIRDRYATAGQALTTTAQQYHLNRERWLAVRDCSLRRPLRLQLQPQICPTLDVLVQYVNHTAVCQLDVVLTAAFTTSPAGGTGQQLAGHGSITGLTTTTGTAAPAAQRYIFGGSWPEYSVQWPQVRPGESVHARFRLSFADCGQASVSGASAAYVVRGTLTGTSSAAPLQIRDATGTLVPASASASAALECPGDREQLQPPHSCWE